MIDGPYPWPDEHVLAVVERRKAGEPSVWGYRCPEDDWVLPDKEETCPSLDCDEKLKAVRGYWGTCDEWPDDPKSWFYTLDTVREFMASSPRPV